MPHAMHYTGPPSAGSGNDTSSNFQKDLNRIVAKAHEITSRLNFQHQPADDTLSRVHELLLDLNISLEELSVATEEVHAQNNQLTMARQELTAERLRYESFFHFCPDPYFITDPRGVIEEVNRAAMEMLGSNAASLVGKPLAFLVVEGDRSLFRAVLNERGGPESGRDAFLQVRTFREGGISRCAVRHAPVRDETDTIRTIYWLFRDIT